MEPEYSRCKKYMWIVNSTPWETSLLFWSDKSCLFAIRRHEKEKKKALCTEWIRRGMTTRVWRWDGEKKGHPHQSLDTRPRNHVISLFCQRIYIEESSLSVQQHGTGSRRRPQTRTRCPLRPPPPLLPQGSTSWKCLSSFGQSWTVDLNLPFSNIIIFFFALCGLLHTIPQLLFHILQHSVVSSSTNCFTARLLMMINTHEMDPSTNGANTNWVKNIGLLNTFFLIRFVKWGFTHFSTTSCCTLDLIEQKHPTDFMVEIQ